MTEDNLHHIFVIEAKELLAQLEDALLQLEDNPSSQEAIEQVFRSAHTLKGSGGMAGLTDVAELSHELETAFDLVRSGCIDVSPELISMTLWVSDFIKSAIVGDGDRGADGLQRVKAFVATLRQICNIAAGRTSPPPELSTAAAPAEAAAAAGAACLYLIRFCPDPEIFQRGLSPAKLLSALGDLGPCQIVARQQNIPAFDVLDPELCHVFWDVLLQTAADDNAIRDIFIFVEGDSRLQITRIERAVPGGESEREELRRLLESADETDFERLRQRLEVPRAAVMQPAPAVPLPAAQTGERPPAAAAAGKDKEEEDEGQYEFLRVRADRLDALINLVGELVTLQGRLAATAAGYADPVLSGINEEAERLTLSLRRQVLKTRMVPIGRAFHRYRRLVRDLAQELGKDIDLVTVGEKTEIDKTMIDQLQDPLVHLVRNCIDHGIETPEVRRSLGKAPRGTIRLAASQRGTHIVLEISDDGAGLHLDKIRAKAERLGIIAADTPLREQDIAELVFHSGLSTAHTVSKISGRGVGMDAVKKTVLSLRGSIEIETRPAAGTTFSIKLPLTLAIVDGLLVQVGRRHYVMPLTEVRECIELHHEAEAHAHGRNLLMVRGEIVPYLHLREQFAIAGERPPMEQVVIVQSRGERIGLVVDRVIGGHQTVIKSLGHLCQNVPGISGATILGDGGVALTLDLPQLFAMAKAQEQRDRVREDLERRRSREPMPAL